MKKPIAAPLFLLVIFLAACSNFVQPSPTVVPTLAPTNTSVPLTQTPDGQFASEWKGIPIMPDAIAGEGDEESYVFTIKATPREVQEYYRFELGKLGWQPFSTGDGDSSLIFMNNASETLTVSIIAKGDKVLVLLVK